MTKLCAFFSSLSLFLSIYGCRFNSAGTAAAAVGCCDIKDIYIGKEKEDGEDGEKPAEQKLECLEKDKEENIRTRKRERAEEEEAAQVNTRHLLCSAEEEHEHLITVGVERRTE